jgi:hypothetical protein
LGFEPKTVRPEYEVQRLKHRRLADIVVADENHMIGQEEVGIIDAAEI